MVLTIGKDAGARMRPSHLTNRCAVLLLMILASAARAAVAKKPPDLVLRAALPVDGPADLQPSGLCWWRGNLLMVSDKHDGTVFRLKVGKDRALAEQFVTFIPPADGAGRLDYEGVACDALRNFYIVSESRSRILQVTPDGSNALWYSPPLEDAGLEAGLLRSANAGFEGIAMTAPNRFVLCAEREPRGIMEVNLDVDPMETMAYQCGRPAYELQPGRSADFTDLCVFGDSLYALVRNAHAVVVLRAEGGRYVESGTWSYGFAENDIRYQYVDMKYGKAEGLAVDAQQVCIIIDNNGMARRSDRKDCRPLLFIFSFPPPAAP